MARTPAPSWVPAGAEFDPLYQDYLSKKRTEDGARLYFRLSSAAALAFLCVVVAMYLGGLVKAGHVTVVADALLVGCAAFFRHEAAQAAAKASAAAALAQQQVNQNRQGQPQGTGQ